MSTHWPKPGINLVGEYQASGHVFVVTGSANTIFLKYVASSVTVAASDSGNFTVYDSSHTGTPFLMPSGSVATFKGKFLTFDVPAELSAMVEVTNIPSASYNPPSGSQIIRHS